MLAGFSRPAGPTPSESARPMKESFLFFFGAAMTLMYVFLNVSQKVFWSFSFLFLAILAWMGLFGGLVGHNSFYLRVLQVTAVLHRAPVREARPQSILKHVKSLGIFDWI